MTIPDATFWRGRRVFLTGHSGFVGGWLAFWLHRLGADVTGYSLPPPTTPSFFALTGLGSLIHSIEGDVRDLAHLSAVLRASDPQLILHLAAQPLVRRAYDQPVETFAVNVMGTVNLLEAARDCAHTQAIGVFTTDKVYRNLEDGTAYAEDDRLGGHEPYSASKTASEYVTASYARSYFGRLGIATVRAGNIIGGGDWAVDRLLPDAVRAFAKGQVLEIRNPNSIRPWQHVLEAARGIIIISQRLTEKSETFAGAWNLGPAPANFIPVRELADRFAALWGNSARWDAVDDRGPPEAGLLRLSSTKAKRELGWSTAWSMAETLSATAEWYKAALAEGEMAAVTARQISDYVKDCARSA